MRTLLLALLSLASSCALAQASFSVTVANPLDAPRPDAVAEVPWAALAAALPGLGPDAVRVVDAEVDAS